MSLVIESKLHINHYQGQFLYEYPPFLLLLYEEVFWLDQKPTNHIN